MAIFDWLFAPANAGTWMAIKTAITPITTNNSSNVNPFALEFLGLSGVFLDPVCEEPTIPQKVNLVFFINDPRIIVFK